MQTLVWIEGWELSTWLRESEFAFPVVITLHTLGMAFLAGVNAVIDLRLLGFARQIPLTALQSIFPVLWIGLCVNVITGILLVISYPAKALTNPVFYIKLLCVAAALSILLAIRKHLSRIVTETESKTQARWLAVSSLLFWTASIIAGRLLPYTHTTLFAG